MCRRGKKNRRISDSVKLFKIIAIIHIFHKIKKLKFFQKGVDFSLEKAVIIYLVKRTTAKTTKKCRSGGIGRRAGFRCLWSQDRVGSSPISCIIFRFAYQEWSRWTNSDYPDGKCENFPSGYFYFSRKENNSDMTFYAQYTLQKYSRKEISVIRQK